MPDHQKWDGPPPWKEWNPEYSHRRRAMGRRFGCLFLGFVLFFILLLVGGLLLIWQTLDRNTGSGLALLAVLCGVPLALFVVAAVAGNFFYRRVGRPVTDMMAAADSIAAGDLSVRVPDETRGPVGRLAHRFNLMTAELERSEQQRRNLTADVAHELRTPLHIIQGNLEGVVDGVYEPDAEHIQATLDEVQRLTRLVTDLQLLSTAEAGQLALHRQEVPVADLLEDTAIRFEAQAAEQEIELAVSVTGDDLMVTADPDRIDQVLSNLVGNALRHTAAGGRIDLAATRNGGQAILTIADTGVGIAAEDVPYIFDRFWRGDRSRTRDGYAGSGLGLAIARQLILAHGGTISAESELGVGTTFTIVLPLPQTA